MCKMCVPIFLFCDKIDSEILVDVRQVEVRFCFLHDTLCKIFLLPFCWSLHKNAYGSHPAVIWPWSLLELSIKRQELPHMSG